MFRADLLRTPAWWPAFSLVLLFCLSGCSLLAKKDAGNAVPLDGTQVMGSEQAAEGASEGGAARGAARAAFTVEVRAPDNVRDYVSRNLELQRYRQLEDLGRTELSRLMVAAEANARELLNTQGYFTPTLTLEMLETTGDDAVAPRTVVVTIEPGPLSRVASVDIGFTGPIAGDTASLGQRADIVSSWSLRQGQPFTQSGWDAAKSGGLRAITARRYPTASIQASRAEIDADQQQARLRVSYESGPAYRFGPLVVNGSQRYDPDAARRIARLPTGAEYDQNQLLEAQQRLASSGYFESVFLTLDTSGGNPLAAPVIAQVREATLQKVVFGAGFTTDAGPRLSVDHIHNQLPLLGWRAVSKASVDSKTQSLGSEWTALPDNDNWRWFGSGLLQQDESGSYDVASGRVRAGRSKSSGRIDRSYFAQYDYAVNRGTDAPPSASTLSLNWGWTGRYFDNPAEPRRGQALAIELAGGYTLLGERVPYARTYVRWLGVLPLGDVQAPDGSRARSSRLQVRAEAGAVLAKESARIPATQLFLTGGDTSVRGYGYREIGAIDANGAIVAGRYLTTGSVEWQRPVVWNGRMTEFESVAFVDAGAVADRASELKAKVGVGVGARWNSPVGLVQGDLAYGVQARKIRLHVRLGFSF
ncbi:MAG: outer membrane protein assembly factor [Comamonadaceae bacterium]|nr:MAG: outer membrane protein assembly factor [Comamonadaceae bacterium]